MLVEYWRLRGPARAKARAAFDAEAAKSEFRRIAVHEFASEYANDHGQHAFKSGTGYRVFDPSNETSRRLAYCLAQTKHWRLPTPLWAKLTPEAYLVIVNGQRRCPVLFPRGRSLLLAILELTSEHEERTATNPETATRDGSGSRTTESDSGT